MHSRSPETLDPNNSIITMTEQGGAHVGFCSSTRLASLAPSATSRMTGGEGGGVLICCLHSFFGHFPYRSF